MTTPPGGSDEARPKARSSTLRQTASAVFAVTAVVPLMIVVWTLFRLDALWQLPSQIGLALALAIALLGFVIFRRLMGEMSDAIGALGKALERNSRALSEARAPAAAPAPAGQQGTASWARAAAPLPRPAGVPGKAAAPDRPAGTAPVPTPGPAPAEAPPPPPSRAPTPTGVIVPGLGAIREVHDLARAMAVLWQAEASAVKGRRVLVSVMTSGAPVAGILVDVSDGGIVLETEAGEHVAVGYERISSIDPERPPADTPHTT